MLQKKVFIVLVLTILTLLLSSCSEKSTGHITKEKNKEIKQNTIYSAALPWEKEGPNDMITIKAYPLMENTARIGGIEIERGKTEYNVTSIEHSVTNRIFLNTNESNIKLVSHQKDYNQFKKRNYEELVKMFESSISYRDRSDARDENVAYCASNSSFMAIMPHGRSANLFIKDLGAGKTYKIQVESSQNDSNGFTGNSIEYKIGGVVVDGENRVWVNYHKYDSMGYVTKKEVLAVFEYDKEKDVFKKLGEKNSVVVGQSGFGPNQERLRLSAWLNYPGTIIPSSDGKGVLLIWIDYVSPNSQVQEWEYKLNVQKYWWS